MGKYLDLADQALRRLDAGREEIETAPLAIAAAAGCADLLRLRPYVDGNRCSDCCAPLGLQGQTVRLAFVSDDGNLTCRDCVRGESEKRRMRARGVAI